MNAARRGPRPTGERLRRLLVMLPWLMERGEVPLADVALRFGLSEAELVKDLELVAMCGVPPFIDELVDVFIVDDMVITGVPRLFTRPLRLTAPEGFALLAAARVAMQLPGADPEGALARALEKLAAVLGPDAVVIDAPAPPMAQDVAAAITDGERLRIGYWSAGADAAVEREVAPRAVFVDRGHWYLIADDHRSGEQRTFRIDRIGTCERTGVFDPPREVVPPTGGEWFVGDDLPAVTLQLTAAAAWVIERYPTRSVAEHGDGWRVELTVADERWLAELLVKLGPAATVVSPERWVHLGSSSAAALLRRYEAHDKVGS